jgi:hypothetical protein
VRHYKGVTLWARRRNKGHGRVTNHRQLDTLTCWFFIPWLALKRAGDEAPE